MSVEKNYEMEDKNNKKVIPSDLAKLRVDEDYKRAALLDALISLDYSHKSEIFGKLVCQFIPNIDYVIPASSIFKLDKRSYREGNTILHVAKSLGEFDFCETLIYNGADFTVKDKNGYPLLSLDTENEYNNYYFDFKIGRESSYKKLVDTVLSAHIEFGNNVNPSDKNGISHFHYACMYSKVELVKFFLDNGVSVHESVNPHSPIYAGFTPLHFAVKYSAVETVELLLNYGADPQITNSKGLNPLHLLIDEKLNTWAQITRGQRTDANRVDQFSQSNLQTFYNKIEKLITLLLERNTEHGFGIYDDTGLSHFHVICTMEDTSIVAKFLDQYQVDLEQRVHGNSALWPGYTALHFAAHFNADTVRLLLKKGATLGAKDTKDVAPFEICLSTMTIPDICSIYSLYPAWSNIRFSDGKTRLVDFIRAMENANEFIAFLRNDVDDVNMYIPLDSPICAGYTPLHLNLICKNFPRNWSFENVPYNFAPAATLEYKMRITQFLYEGANVCAGDARGSTPIHLAFNLQESQVINFFLLFSCQRVSNVVDERGLSVLHVACAVGELNAVNQLLSLGSNVNEATVLSYTCYLINSETLVSNDMELYKSITKGSAPLHIAAIVECSKIVELLIDHNADILAKDADNMTPLERSLGTSILGNIEDPGWDFRDKTMSNGKKRILEILIPRVSDLFADTRPDRMLYCYSLLNDELLNRLLKDERESMRKILESAGITMLHVACFTKNLQQVTDILTEGIDVNAQVDMTSPLWPGCTPLHILTRHHGYDWINERNPEHIEIVSLLLKHRADVAATDAIGSTPFYQTFQFYLTSHSNALFVDMLLDHVVDFDVNPVNAKGLSYLHAACVRDNALVVEKLLQHGAEVNQTVDLFDHNFGGFTAFHFAAAYQSEKAVGILLRNGADVHRKDVLGGNPLHAASSTEQRQPCAGLLQSLISAGANMELRNVFGQRPLEKLMKSESFTNEEVDLFVKNNCCVNVWNPIVDEGCLAMALEVNDTHPIFQTIIKSPKIKNIDENGRNAIHNVVSFIPDWKEYDDDDPIEEIFISEENYTVAIETLVKLDLHIDHQDNQGRTPLHLAAQMQNITGLIGLLNNGANINIVAGDGKTAFAHSLELSKLNEHMDHLDSRILAVISAHLYKLKLIGIGFSISNWKVWHEIATKIPLDITWRHECFHEFEKMKSRKIDVYSVTLKDFLSDTGAVSSYPYMLPEKRQAIDQLFESKADELKDEFPNFIYLLLVQHKKATVRHHLIRPAEVSINFLVDFPMPLVCSRVILKFLSNDDVKNLIASKNV